MSFTAGYKSIIAFTSTDVAYAPGDVLVGPDNLNKPDGREMLDTSHFNAAAEPSNLPGMRIRGPYSFNVNYDPSNAPQALLLTHLTSGAVGYLTLLPDGVNGHRIAVYVTKADITTEAKGKIMMAVECIFEGTTPTAIP